MKYPQLVHMPGDVEHWLEKQLEAQGIDGIVCAKYIFNLLAQVNTNSSPSMECFPCNSQSYVKHDNKKCFQAYCDRQSWDVDSLNRLGVHFPMSALKEKCDIEQLVDELCVKFKGIGNIGDPLLNDSTDLGKETAKVNAPAINSNALLSEKLIDMKETQSFPFFNPIWTRGLLHGSEPVKDQSKMEDYFSSRYYENPSDNFGFEFTCLKSDERQDGKERDRISFYNKQNLLSSECTERLYERNTDMDKLIAKFNANIEGIWKPACLSEKSDKCETLKENSDLTNCSNNLIWSFGNEKCNTLKNESNKNCKSSFSTWSKFSSPIINSNLDPLNNMNFAISKWSSMDGQNDNNVFLNHTRHESCFTEVIPKGNKGSIPKLNPVITCVRTKTNVDDEDLLTSAKTHFRPIRMEEVHSNQAVAYADGTTFAISNELEKVNFTRSDSGIFYLEADSELEAPRKYMEYKEREISTKMVETESDSSSAEEFIPKFRVRQSNEKCCQTEDIILNDHLVPSYKQTDCKSDSSELERDEFFFPFDCELAYNVVNKMEEPVQLEPEQIKSDCNCNDIYITNFSHKISDGNQCVCNVENNFHMRDLRNEWNEIRCAENGDNKQGLPMKDEYFRFKEELTREGEQLLSDLSCLQMLYSNSKWVDDEVVSDNNSEGAANGANDWLEFSNDFKNEKSDEPWKNIWKSDISKYRPDEAVDEDFMKVNENNMTGKLNEIREISLAYETWNNEGKWANSTSQKACRFHEDGQCHKFSFGEPAVPLLFSADASRAIEDSEEGSKSSARPLSF